MRLLLCPRPVASREATVEHRAIRRTDCRSTPSEKPDLSLPATLSLEASKPAARPTFLCPAGLSPQEECAVSQGLLPLPRQESATRTPKPRRVCADPRSFCACSDTTIKKPPHKSKECPLSPSHPLTLELRPPFSFFVFNLLSTHTKTNPSPTQGFPRRCCTPHPPHPSPPPPPPIPPFPFPLPPPSSTANVEGRGRGR